MLEGRRREKKSESSDNVFLSTAVQESGHAGMTQKRNKPRHSGDPFNNRYYQEIDQLEYPGIAPGNAIAQTLNGSIQCELSFCTGDPEKDYMYGEYNEYESQFQVRNARITR